MLPWAASPQPRTMELAADSARRAQSYSRRSESNTTPQGCHNHHAGGALLLAAPQSRRGWSKVSHLTALRCHKVSPHRRMRATYIKASVEAMDFSLSLASLRHRPSHAKCALHDPATRQDLEALGFIRPRDDLHGERADLLHRALKLRSNIAAVGEDVWQATPSVRECSWGYSCSARHSRSRKFMAAS